MAGKNDPKITVFAIHGIGTQLPLSGIQEAVAILEGIPQAHAQIVGIESRVVSGEPGTTVSHARVSLTGQGLPGIVDVCEANYAAIPKGKAGLLEIVQFLLAAGWNGLGANDWKRWLFGAHRDCRPKPYTHLRLVHVLTGVIAALVLNLTFLAALAGVMFRNPSDLSAPAPPYLRTLTVAMIAIFVSLIFFGILTFLAIRISPNREAPHRDTAFFRNLCLASMTLAMTMPLVLVLAGVYIVLVQTGAIREPHAVLIANYQWFLLIRALGAAAATAVLVKLLANRPAMQVATFLGIAVVIVGLGLYFPVLRQTFLMRHIMYLDFVLLGVAFTAISWVGRMFLINYVGDVAAYVGGSRASKFAETREQVQACVYEGLRHLLDEGYTVVVLGHSLGSVVGYDVVNRLLLNQADRPGRIGALVTYGSPLDKLAYLFKVEDPHGNEVRSRLVASRQPLVFAEVRERLPWWNVQAPYDIIGSRLIYYDRDPTRPGVSPGDIRHLADPTNRIPILSHLRYAEHPVLSQALGEALRHVACDPDHSSPPPNGLE